MTFLCGGDHAEYTRNSTYIGEESKCHEKQERLILMEIYFVLEKMEAINSVV